MIPTAELEAAQATAVGALPDSCDVQRRTVTSDGAGGQTETWTTVATVPCRVAPSGGASEGIVANESAGRAGFVVTVPSDTDVRGTDRLVIDDRQLEVVAVLTRSWEVARRVECVQVT